MRGLSFEIPNQYGQYLFDILNGTNLKEYFWKTGGGEAYYIENNELGKALFSTPYVYTSEDLYNRISTTDYYVIFADLKAFTDLSQIKEIATYEDFLSSHCEFVLLIVDCAYVTIYAKDQHVTARIYSNAINKGFENVEFITDENDRPTTLIAF